MFDKEPAALFIDGANFSAAMRLAHADMDFTKMLAFFKKKYTLRRAYYYTALLDRSQHSGVRQLVDWLDYNGYSCVTKDAKEFKSNDVTTIKGNMDIEMTVDMLRMAPHIKHLHLFTGDGDFVYLLREVQNMGINVVVYSTMKTGGHVQYPMVAAELRKQADEFIDLDDWVREKQLYKTEP